MFWRLLVKVFPLDNNECESNREKETKKEKLSNISFQGDSLSLAFISGQSEAVLVR